MFKTIPYINNQAFLQKIRGPNSKIYYYDDNIGMPSVGVPLVLENGSTCRIQFKPRFQYLESHISYVENWNTVGKCIVCKHPHQRGNTDVQQILVSENNTCVECWTHYDQTDWADEEDSDEEESDDEQV
jgi:hypothetical protein